jgi:cell division protein FtsZ
MIEVLRTTLTNSDCRIKILGVGGAGGNVLDRLHLDGSEGAELVALNTDVQALAGSVAGAKVQMGVNTTSGLGAGGDPEVGYAAADEAADEIRAAVEGAAMVFLCVGLGGGTGSGSAAIIASIARQEGALVIVFATLPFSFEGKRRIAQAEEALATLEHYADTVICFENDKMADTVSPRATIQEAFAADDQTFSQSIRAMVSLTRRRGIVHVGFDELGTALRNQNARCIFGYGEAEGDTRAHTALERALKNPLLDRGRLLGESANVLVNVVGGANTTLNEVQILMDELNRHIGPQTRILFGVAVDPRLTAKLTVTIVSSLGSENPVRMAPLSVGPVPKLAAIVEAQRPEEETEALEEPEEFEAEPPAPRIAFVATDDEVAAVAPPAPAPPAPPVSAPRPVETAVPVARQISQTKSKSVMPASDPKREVRQEQMQFEPVTRGRFEKSEPTIVDGQDLDVPTFLRRNVRAR